MVEELRIALRNAGRIDPRAIEDYIGNGGYTALASCREMKRDELISLLENSGKLRGRGGAGFNTGSKWRSAFEAQGPEKYVICNADEGEPGTYKDREIMENDPHTVIEGMLICAHIIGASACYIYCRGEYRGVIDLLKEAIGQAREKGITKGIDFRVVSGAGSYVCGEETALIESLEGKRGEPRSKPPFPTIAGFRGKPTIVNNVETFATVPVIVEKGADWFRTIGSPTYPGTKVFCLSGDVVNRACFEAPTDITLHDLIYSLGGGIPEGRTLKAVQVGGSACPFVSGDALHTPLDFDSMRKVGASLGSGAVLVVDDRHNMVDILAGISAFFAHESCGKCAPCREGTLQVATLVKKIADGKGIAQDIDQIRCLSDHLTVSCFCPLGQSATTALQSALELFPEDFAAKVTKEEVAAHD